MQFLTISQRSAGASCEVWAALREAESCRARTLYMEGHIRHIWHRDDVTGACLLWEADSEDPSSGNAEYSPFCKSESAGSHRDSAETIRGLRSALSEGNIGRCAV